MLRHRRRGRLWSQPKPRNRSRATRCGNGRRIMHQQHTLCAAFLSFLMFSVGAAWADPPKLPVPAFDQSAVGQRGYFYVGGQYIGEDGKNIMRRQVYVEV